MAKSYDYTNVSNSKHGLMICASCGKKIIEGDYRYHEKPETYVTVHRACCQDDPKWKKIDADHASHIERFRAMRAEAIAFRAKWGICDLDELIAELRPYALTAAGVAP